MQQCSARFQIGPIDFHCLEPDRESLRNLPWVLARSACRLCAEYARTTVRRTGMERDELLAGLSQQLPEFVDHLTPRWAAADRGGGGEA
jgi:hypothetical protein